MPDASKQIDNAETVKDNGDSYDVVVILADEYRTDIPDLEKIYVQGTNGLVSVANFAEVVRGTGPVSINREDQSRVIHLTASISDGSNAGEVFALIIILAVLLVFGVMAGTYESFKAPFINLFTMPVLNAYEDAAASRLRPILRGLTSSTIVTMFIIPVIYSLMNKNAENKNSSEIPDELKSLVKTEAEND